MSSITENFALTLSVYYISFSNPGTKDEITWVTYSSSVIKVRLGSVWYNFDTEAAAWEAACRHYPGLISELRHSPVLVYRGYALRAEMMLSLGENTFNAMKEAVYAEVLAHSLVALDLLGATPCTKAAPQVVRVSKHKAISWLEVRTRVNLPFESGPVRVSIRFYPSPIEENTWSVRLRLPGTTDASIYAAQRCLDKLTDHLKGKGITVKDVLNGTCLDL